MQTFLSLGTVAAAVGLVMAVWASKVTASSANAVLTVAWGLFTYSVFTAVPAIVRQPLVPRVMWTLIAAGAGGLALHWWLWTPPPSSVILAAPTGAAEEADGAAVAGAVSDSERRFIRDAIGELVYELRQVSGREFRNECLLLDGEQLTPPKPPMALFALTPNARFTVVTSLHSLTTAFAGVEGSFMFQQNPPEIGGRHVKEGYEKVFEEYNSLLGKPWAIAATRYKNGEPLTGNETFNTCIYGLRAIDETSTDSLLNALDAAEARGLPRVRRFLQADPPAFVAHAEAFSDRPIIARGGRIILDVTDQPEARLGDVYDPGTRRFKKTTGSPTLSE